MSSIQFSQPAWNRVTSIADWELFMEHDRDNPSRQMAYGEIVTHLSAAHLNREVFLLEVGFGSGIDFTQCFKLLHDKGAIVYTGIDITPLFVEFACDCWPGYQFMARGFADLEPLSQDITYTRHTLEHASPKVYRESLHTLLRAARRLCIVTWFLPPDMQEFVCEDDIWHNVYDKSVIGGIIDYEGFGLQAIEVGSDTIYIMERKQ